MRPDAEQLARGEPSPVPGANASSPALGTALLLLVMVGLLLTASYPTASTVLFAAALVVRRVARPIFERLRRTARERGVNSVCVPGTDVCLEA